MTEKEQAELVDKLAELQGFGGRIMASDGDSGSVATGIEEGEQGRGIWGALGFAGGERDARGGLIHRGGAADARQRAAVAIGAAPALPREGEQVGGGRRVGWADKVGWPAGLRPG
jgi:hypothetical protein